MARHNARNLPNKERRSLKSLVISVASALFPALMLERKNTGAGAALLELYHNSASPANSDNHFRIEMDINDSNITRENIVEIAQTMSSVTAGSEDAVWYLYNNRGSVFLFGGNGVYWSGFDGQSPPGALGEMNCAGYYLNGERFPLSVAFASSGQTLVDAGLVTVAHGLSARPGMIQLALQCTVNSSNWVVGESFFMGSNGQKLMAAYADDTNVYVRYHSTMSAGLNGVDKTTGANFAINFANWVLIIKAWK